MSIHQHSKKFDVQEMYVINLSIESVGGTRKVSEEDLGLPTGTLPPHDVACLPSLITLDRNILRPGHNIYGRAKRLCEKEAFTLGLGVIVEGDRLDYLIGELEKLQREYMDWKEEVLAEYTPALEKRIQEKPEYAKLLKAFAPALEYVKNRIKFEIDVTRITISDSDPHIDKLRKTLSRSNNNIYGVVVKEVVREFCRLRNSWSNAAKKGATSRNIPPVFDLLIPKMSGVAVINKEVKPLLALVQSTLTDAMNAFELMPKNQTKILVGADAKLFFDRLALLTNEDSLHEYLENNKGMNMSNLDKPVVKPVIRHSQNELFNEQKQEITPPARSTVATFQPGFPGARPCNF